MQLEEHKEHAKLKQRWSELILQLLHYQNKNQKIDHKEFQHYLMLKMIIQHYNTLKILNKKKSRWFNFCSEH
jgi:hypothetical protein